VARFTRAKETLIVREGLVKLFKETKYQKAKTKTINNENGKEWLVQLIKKPSLSEALKELS